LDPPFFQQPAYLPQISLIGFVSPMLKPLTPQRADDIHFLKIFDQGQARDTAEARTDGSESSGEIDEGIVAGGGVAYIRTLKSLETLKGDNEDENTGIQIIRRSLEEPLRQIVANCGIEGSIVVQNIKEGEADYGFNARTEVYENMFKAGVIDPTKVARVALENAASIAGMLLTTECVLSEKKEEGSAMAPNPGMGGMGGMM
jgi:chaperonin GroEL